MITRHTEWTLLAEKHYQYWVRTAGLQRFHILETNRGRAALNVYRFDPEGDVDNGTFFTESLDDAKQLAEAIATLSEGGWDE